MSCCMVVHKLSPQSADPSLPLVFFFISGLNCLGSLRGGEAPRAGPGGFTNVSYRFRVFFFRYKILIRTGTIFLPGLHARERSADCVGLRAKLSRPVQNISEALQTECAHTVRADYKLLTGSRFAVENVCGDSFRGVFGMVMLPPSEECSVCSCYLLQRSIRYVHATSFRGVFSKTFRQTS